jgi:hypothetical protein
MSILRLHTWRDDLYSISSRKKTGDWVASSLYVGQPLEIVGMNRKFGYPKGTCVSGVIKAITPKQVNGRRRVEIEFDMNDFKPGLYPNIRCHGNPVHYI